MMCQKENCEGILSIVNTDSRQEWTEEELICDSCDAKYSHRTEFDQNGLVVSDKITKEEN